MKQNSIKKNLAYNLIYQVLIILIPFVTSPYLARVLGAEKLGIYSYSHAYANYFVLAILLGVNNYGNREIARARDNKEKLNKVFSEIYSIQFVMLIFVSIVYLSTLLFVDNENKIIYMIQYIYVFSAGLDINWCCFGLEKFKLTVTRNSIIKIIGAIAIFVFVKGQSDLWIYILIMTASALISQIAVWPFIMREIRIIPVKWKNVKAHFKPLLLLFIPVLAVSLYNYMDKIMVGLMCDKSEVGYYTYAEQIIVIPRSFVTALGTVMLPRTSNLLQNGKEEENFKLIAKSMQLAMFICMASCFGVAAISNDFIPWYYGEDFSRCAIFTMFLAPTVVFAGWNNVVRTQYVIPRRMDSIYLTTVSVGAVVNLILNLVLIKLFRGMGAIIATVCAEASVCIVQYLLTRKGLSFRKFKKDTIVFMLCGIIMGAVVFFIPNISEHTITNILIKIAAGIMLYLSITYLYMRKISKDTFIFDSAFALLKKLKSR